MYIYGGKVTTKTLNTDWKLDYYFLNKHSRINLFLPTFTYVNCFLKPCSVIDYKSLTAYTGGPWHILFSNTNNHIWRDSLLIQVSFYLKYLNSFVICILMSKVELIMYMWKSILFPRCYKVRRIVIDTMLCQSLDSVNHAPKRILIVID